MIFIDGHNLAFADDEAKLLLTGGDPDGARLRVLELVVAFAATTRKRITIVFDGTGGGRGEQPDHGQIRYRFSGADRTADAAILELLAQHTGRRDTMVVTGDRALAAGARRQGADTMGVGEFLHEVDRAIRKQRSRPKPEPRGKRTGAPPSEVAYWLDVFTNDDRYAAEKERPLRKSRRKKKP
jgi:predicted RNA-binding protein with PIN domain